MGVPNDSRFVHRAGVSSVPYPAYAIALRRICVLERLKNMFLNTFYKI